MLTVSSKHWFSLLVAKRYKTLHKYEYRYEAESLNAINGASQLKNGPKAACTVGERSFTIILCHLSSDSSERHKKKTFTFSHRLKLKYLRLVVSSFAPLAVAWVRWLTWTQRATLCSVQHPALMPLLLKWRSMLLNENNWCLYETPDFD